MEGEQAVPRGLPVPGLTWEECQCRATALRRLIGLHQTELPHILEVIEGHIVPLGLEIDVRETADMSVEAETFPDIGWMNIREDVYHEAIQDSMRARFTLSHELGHLFLHGGLTGYARSVGPASHPFYCDSEWQADLFAAEFLMPRASVCELCGVPADIAAVFRVSSTAARIRWKQLTERGFFAPQEVITADLSTSQVGR